MTKNGDPGDPKKRPRGFLGKTSSLELFINTHGKKFESLTNSEIEVLTLLAKGLEKVAIIKELGLSTNTFQKYLSSLQVKLAIKTQADYVKYALAFGLIRF